MSEPTTKAGRRLLGQMQGVTTGPLTHAEAIIAIEREAIMDGAAKAIHFVADSAEASRIVATDAGWDEVHEAIQAMLPYVEVARARAQLRAEIAKGVEGLHRYSFALGLESDGEFLDRAAVLALIRPTDE